MIIYMKRLGIAIALCLTVQLSYSQVWTAQDSLRLRKLLDSKEELQLNKEAVRAIDFGGVTVAPKMSEQKNWLLPDESVVGILPKSKTSSGLMTWYKNNILPNWGTACWRKAKTNNSIWSGTSVYALPNRIPYSEWKRSLLAEGMYTPFDGIRVGQAYINGGTIGGLDLMAPFTKDFWDKKGRENRIRTLEVLRTYGDSATVSINRPIEPIVR